MLIATIFNFTGFDDAWRRLICIEAALRYRTAAAVLKVLPSGWRLGAGPGALPNE
jgi:hypothetical protein